MSSAWSNINFNPRSPEESDENYRKDALKGDKFQSTLSRRERQGSNYTLEQVYRISIHALPKRATGVHFYLDDYQFISIHALPKRATNLSGTYAKDIYHFNPRSPEESDALLHFFG